MTTFADLLRSRTAIEGAQATHLRRLVGSWRPLADLSFADLLLIAPVAHEEGRRFVVLAHIRPTTGQTVYPIDVIGTVVDEVERPLLARAWRLGDIVGSDTTALGSKDRVRVQAIPVRHDGDLVALVTREHSPSSARRPGELERTYQEVFEKFARMISEGSFPFTVDEVELESAPRVGDGVIVIDDNRVKFASPNAVSSLHRMGIHAYARGLSLREIGFGDAIVRDALDTQLPVTEEIERGEVSVLLRVLPVLDRGRSTGAILLLRDVTDLRRRDRMLMSKDATIREIHHRVKNNLQTIASLLRLQGRRLESDEAREALAESERRIRSIAIVHETLSREAAADVVAFGDIVRPLVRVVEESVASSDTSIRFTVVGDAGDLPGEVATPLAVILNELMQNAVDHAFPEVDGRREGHVTVHLAREDDQVVVEVVDDGIGLPPDFGRSESLGLGLSIVNALVTGELGGSIEVHDDEGTHVQVRVPIAMPRVEL